MVREPLLRVVVHGIAVTRHESVLVLVAATASQSSGRQYGSSIEAPTTSSSATRSHCPTSRHMSIHTGSQVT